MICHSSSSRTIGEWPRRHTRHDMAKTRRSMAHFEGLKRGRVLKLRKSDIIIQGGGRGDAIPTLIAHRRRERRGKGMTGWQAITFFGYYIFAEAFRICDKNANDVSAKWVKYPIIRPNSIDTPSLIICGRSPKPLNANITATSPPPRSPP